MMELNFTRLLLCNLSEHLWSDSLESEKWNRLLAVKGNLAEVSTVPTSSFSTRNYFLLWVSFMVMDSFQAQALAPCVAHIIAPQLERPELFPTTTSMKIISGTDSDRFGLDRLSIFKTVVSEVQSPRALSLGQRSHLDPSFHSGQWHQVRQWYPFLVHMNQKKEFSSKVSRWYREDVRLHYWRNGDLGSTIICVSYEEVSTLPNATLLARNTVWIQSCIFSIRNTLKISCT